MADERNLSFITEKLTVVYVKGCSRYNRRSSGRPGIGIWFNESHHLNVSELFAQHFTNSNTPDIQASVRAIRIAHELDIKNLKIKTNCRFVIEAMTNYIYTWKKNGWKKRGTNNDIKNKADFIELDEACQLFGHVLWELVEEEGNPALNLAKLATH